MASGRECVLIAEFEVEEAVFLRFTSETAFLARDEVFLAAITYLLTR